LLVIYIIVLIIASYSSR